MIDKLRCFINFIITLKVGPYNNFAINFDLKSRTKYIFYNIRNYNFYIKF